MITEDSRHNYSIIIRTLNGDGTEAENERVHLPYPREPIVQSLRPDIQEYTWMEGDTWSNIAARFLRGRSDLWWVIAEFTGVIDPFSEGVVGKVLKIPQWETVLFEVLNFKDKTGGRGLRDLDSER